MASFYDWAEGEALGDQHRTVHNELGYIKRGTGSPEGVHTADVGSLFIRSDGGADTILYAKETGSGNTGWVALGSVAALTNHLADTADAHDASAISILDAGSDFTATDVEGALDELQADNEAHTAAADPHTGYRLESADHPHTSTGANAGQLDHGAALTGLTDDDHTQYLKETDVAAKGDQYVASANDTVAVVGVGTNGQRWTPSSGDAEGIIWADDEFTVGGVLMSPTGAKTLEVWRAPFACEVMAYHARVVGGTNAVTNAQVDASDILTGDLTTTPGDGWEAGTIVSSGVEDITAGEIIKLEVVSISGVVTEISWTITLRRAA